MRSISKLTFTRFNFFKFPLILQNASAIRNHYYMKTGVEHWWKLFRQHKKIRNK